MSMDIAIPGYTILQKLGEGGMATVWQARQENLDRMVAIKMLKQPMDEVSEDYQRFLYEARAAASLIHPHIVQVIDAGESEGYAYYVMEYVPGTTVMDRFVRKEPYPEEEALRICREVAQALDYGWRDHHVVHCDIKPDNLLIHRNGRTKVADLGLARVQNVDAVDIEEGMTLGTPNYFAPEQALADREFDCRTDIYALGSTMYHMVTGQLPFEGLEPQRVAEEQVHGYLPDPIEINRRCSAGVCYLIERLMAKDPDDRHTDWLEVLEDIDSVMDGKMIRSPLRNVGLSTVERSERRPEIRQAPARNGIQRGGSPRRGRAQVQDGSGTIRRGGGGRRSAEVAQSDKPDSRAAIRVARRRDSGVSEVGTQAIRTRFHGAYIWPVAIVCSMLAIGLYAYTYLQAVAN